MTFLLLLLAVQSSQAPEIVVEKKKPKEVCNIVNTTGSRLRSVRRCTKPKPDPNEKIDELEAQRAVDLMIQQDRINHAACVQAQQRPANC
jgi:cell division protein FtsN